MDADTTSTTRKAAMLRELEADWQQVSTLLDVDAKTRSLLERMYWYGVIAGVLTFVTHEDDDAEGMLQ